MQSNSNYTIEPLANAHCLCGENPLWDEQKKLVYWTDIPNGFLYRLDVQSGKWDRIYDGESVGGLTLQPDGKLLLFRDHNIAVMDEAGNVKVVTDEVEADTGRFNDVITDPEGRVFAGTGSDNGALNSGLFRVDLDGTVTRLWSGTSCSNGMAFTTDLKQMFWTDSTARKIFLFDYHRASGELSNRREFYSPADDKSIPDGMTIDTSGDIWTAHWDGFAVHHLSPEGQLKESIEFPVGQVTSVTFGGDNLDELYVTTAGGSARKGKAPGEDTPNGTLYRVRGVGAKGRLEFRSQIQTN